MSLLEKSILATIVYYDTLDYPLTGFEIYKYLINPLRFISLTPDRKIEEAHFNVLSLSNILKALKSQNLRQCIEEKNGFYFLSGRGDIIRTHIERKKIAARKWKKAKRIISLMQVIPYIRMVAISGSLALNNTKKESDIDILIVTANKRIWISRFLTALFIQLIGKKRRGKSTKDKICLNHYITDASLEIKFTSLYNAQTYAHLVPILELEKGIYARFQEANKWIRDYLVFYPEPEAKNLKTFEPNFLSRGLARFEEMVLNGRLGNILEKKLEKWQKKHIKKDPLTYKKGGRVTVDDTQLEFHPDSPEKGIIDKYNATMKKLGFSEARERDSGLRVR